MRCPPLTYTINDQNKKINIGASPEPLFNLFNQNTSFIEKSLSRTGDDVKKPHNDPNCIVCTRNTVMYYNNWTKVCPENFS